MIASVPSNSRAFDAGRSSWPRWTPSAPAASATSTRSLTSNRTSNSRQALAIATARSWTRRSSVSLSRYSTQLAPPLATARTASTSEAVVSGSMIGKTGDGRRSGVAALRNLPSLLILIGAREAGPLVNGCCSYLPHSQDDHQYAATAAG